MYLVAAAPGGHRDDAGLGVAELGRGGAGGDRGLLERVGADLDLGPGAAIGLLEDRALAGAAIAGLDRDAVDVGGVLVVAAAPDRQRVGGAGGDDARLQRQDLVQPVDREVLHHLAVHPLLGADLVARDQRLLLGHDGDLLDLDRRLLQLDVHRPGLVGQHANAIDLGRLVPDERGPDRDRAGRDVVHEVVALGIRQRVERASRR